MCVCVSLLSPLPGQSVAMQCCLTISEVLLHDQLVLLLVSPSNDHEVLRADEPEELLKPAAGQHDSCTPRQCELVLENSSGV